MKTLTYLFSLLFITSVSIAQEKPSMPELKKPKDNKQLLLVLDLTFDNWLHTPDSIKNNIIKSRGANIYAMYDLRLNDNFSFAAGAGIGSNNFSNNAKLLIRTTA